MTRLYLFQLKPEFGGFDLCNGALVRAVGPKHAYAILKEKETKPHAEPHTGEVLDMDKYEIIEISANGYPMVIITDNSWG